jgi:hypothetical protein
MLLTIALVLALVAPLYVALPLFAMGVKQTAGLRLVGWCDDHLHWLGSFTALQWSLALVIAVIGWLR